jgi:predicted amidohydrolase YtcJ
VRPRRLPEGFAFAAFIDAHAHLGGLGRARWGLDLSSAFTEEDFVRLLSAGTPPGDVLLAFGARIQPDLCCRVLDTLFPETPALARRVDEHAICANRAALRRLQELGAGSFDTHSGVFLEAQMELLQKVFCECEYDDDIWLEGFLSEQQNIFLGQGCSCVHEMAVDDRLWCALDGARRRGTLKLRVRAFMRTGSEAVSWEDEDPLLLRRCGSKLFADGALGSSGARLSIPYSNGSQGDSIDSLEARREVALSARERGCQLAVHCIGDVALDETLDLVEALGVEASCRWRVEHVQVASPLSIARLARLGLGVCVQPSHARVDLGWAKPVLGPLLEDAYPYERMRRAGIPIGLGSDHPIEAIDVPGILADACSNESAPSGFPRRFTREAALSAFTRGAAWLGFDEHQLGALRPPFLADFSVWDRDLRQLPVEELRAARCLATVVGGELCWER